MRTYLELAESALAAGARWELGREALRWLVKQMRVSPVMADWRGRFERRLRECQYAERTVETYAQWAGRFAAGKAGHCAKINTDKEEIRQTVK